MIHDYKAGAFILIVDYFLIILHIPYLYACTCTCVISNWKINFFNILFSSVTWVEIDGTLYKPGASVMIESKTLPVFGIIKDIAFVSVDECYFLCSQLCTEFFNSHYHSYQVFSNHSILTAVTPFELIDSHILHQYTILSHPNVSFVPMKYHIMERI